MTEYKIKYYVVRNSGTVPVKQCILSLPEKVRTKVQSYLDLLCANGGYLDEPYSRHIVGKIRELRVDFSNMRHRIFYVTFVNKNIILLNGFVKKTPKTPFNELNKAIRYYNDVLSNPQIYE